MFSTRNQHGFSSTKHENVLCQNRHTRISKTKQTHSVLFTTGLSSNLLYLQPNLTLTPPFKTSGLQTKYLLFAEWNLIIPVHSVSACGKAQTNGDI